LFSSGDEKTEKSMPHRHLILSLAYNTEFIGRIPQGLQAILGSHF
jgi:hypothetical protein